MWKVTYAIDSLDPNPVVEMFEEEYEAIDWLNDETKRRVDHIVEHSPYSVSEEDLTGLFEQEFSLSRIERI